MEKNKYIVGLGIYLAIISLVYFFKVGGPDFSSISIFITIITPIIPIIFGYITLKHFGFNNMQGKSVCFIFLSIVSWWTGDIIWWLFAQNAVVSLADFFYLSGYAMFALGIYFGIRTVDDEFFRSKKKIIFSAIMVLLMFFIYLKFFPLGWDNTLSLIENITTGGYVLADLLLIIGLSFILYFIYLTRRGLYSQAWIAIGGGILFYVNADIYYTINYSSYLSGNPIELVWFYAYILFAFGFILQKYNAEEIFKKILKQKSMNNIQQTSDSKPREKGQKNKK